jgi:ankyrin repeat protein
LVFKKQLIIFQLNKTKLLIMKQALLAFAFQLLLTPLLFSQKLIEAVEAKNYDQVQQHLKNGENVNKTNDQGQFPLWNAVWNEDTKMVALLLKGGADPKQTFKGKEAQSTCLEIAAQEGFLDIVKLLVSAGADIHHRGFRGHTPLRVAARNGRTDLVKYFISKGSEIDSRGDDGATPLEHAASKGHLDIVKLLVESGANINIQDKEGDFALGEAAKGGFIEVVNYLLVNGADISLKNAEGNNAQQLAKLAGQAKIEELLKQTRRG